MFIDGMLNWRISCVVVDHLRVCISPSLLFHRCYLASHNSRDLWKHFGLERFFAQKFLYLVYPTEKDCLILYNIYTVHPTVQLQRTPGVFNNIVKKSYVQVNLNIFIDYEFYTGGTANETAVSYLSTCETMFIGEAFQSCKQRTLWFMKDVDYRIVYHCL